MPKFKVRDWVVYPAHGAGQITSIEENTVQGVTFSTYVIPFEKSETHVPMILRVPVGSADLRRPIPKKDIPRLFKVLTQPKRKGDKVWNRRSRFLKNDLVSGDIFTVAAVVRDTFKPESVEWSYSERLMHITAADMLAREIVASTKGTYDDAMMRINETLQQAHTDN